MSDFTKLSKTILDVLEENSSKKPKPYDIQATVRRVDYTEGKAYVHIPGGIDETPVDLTVSCKKGDTVPIRVGGGRAWIVGNKTTPPTDDAEALVAKGVATKAKKTADVAEETAVDAKDTAEAILVYDHKYEIRTDETSTSTNKKYAHFTAYLYRGGKDIKEQFDPQLFTWSLKTEEYPDGISLGYGYTYDVYINDETHNPPVGYGAEIIGRFTESDDSELLTADNSNITNSDYTPITARATGESVRVRDLETVTTIFDIEKLMVVGNEDEHLITMSSLVSYLNGKIESDKHYVHDQQVSTNVWEVNHNLDKHPAVTVIDDLGREVVGDVNYIDNNNLTITFNAYFSGKAYCN